MPSRIRCMNCGAESFNDGDTKLVCQKCYQSLESLIEKKDEALVDAIATIKALHGPVAWDIYESKAPEMQRIKEALILTGEDYAPSSLPPSTRKNSNSSS